MVVALVVVVAVYNNYFDVDVDVDSNRPNWIRELEEVEEVEQLDEQVSLQMNQIRYQELA